jgi:hypothetical protein
VTACTAYCLFEVKCGHTQKGVDIVRPAPRLCDVVWCGVHSQRADFVQQEAVEPPVHLRRVVRGGVLVELDEKEQKMGRKIEGALVRNGGEMLTLSTAIRFDAYPSYCSKTPLLPYANPKTSHAPTHPPTHTSDRFRSGRVKWEASKTFRPARKNAVRGAVSLT